MKWWEQIESAILLFLGKFSQWITFPDIKSTNFKILSDGTLASVAPFGFHLTQ